MYKCTNGEVDPGVTCSRLGKHATHTAREDAEWPTNNTKGEIVAGMTGEKRLGSVVKCGAWDKGEHCMHCNSSRWREEAVARSRSRMNSLLQGHSISGEDQTLLHVDNRLVLLMVMCLGPSSHILVAFLPLDSFNLSPSSTAPRVP